MQLDTNLLLSAEKLHLEPGLVRGKTTDRTFAFKRVESQTYLVVNELQAAVLEQFAHPRNVPEALEACIRQRSCTPLREFYDLILKAHQAGVLRSEELGAEGPPAAPRPPSHWPVPLPTVASLSLLGIGILATLAALVLRSPVLPTTFLDGLIGWAAACGALSLGYVLSACALRSADCEVYHPRVRWTTLTPHFAVDLRDACMAGRAERIAILGLTLLPLALTAAVALWLRETWS